MSDPFKQPAPLDFIALLKATSALPGVKINRTEFLNSALRPHFPELTVENAVRHNPAAAGIGLAEINEIAASCIKYETTKVTTLSFAAGIPGGLAMLGTVPADLAQYFGHILRILQKLVYLYGWQELFDEQGQLDDETSNLLTLFAGIMFGVNGATSAITKLVDSATQNMVTKGTLYPIVKKIAANLGIRLSRDVFAKGAAKVVPLVGGIASGGLTYMTYKPMAEKLRAHLSTLKFADPGFYADNHIKDIIEIDDFVAFDLIPDVEFESIQSTSPTPSAEEC